MQSVYPLLNPIYGRALHMRTERYVVVVLELCAIASPTKFIWLTKYFHRNSYMQKQMTNNFGKSNRVKFKLCSFKCKQQSECIYCEYFHNYVYEWQFWFILWKKFSPDLNLFYCCGMQLQLIPYDVWSVTF